MAEMLSFWIFCFVGNREEEEEEPFARLLEKEEYSEFLLYRKVNITGSRAHWREHPKALYQV